VVTRSSEGCSTVAPVAADDDDDDDDVPGAIARPSATSAAMHEPTIGSVFPPL